MLSPANDSVVREAKISETLVLVIAKDEKRIWLHDVAAMMNHLIPITNFYNELMIYKKIRDPLIALKSNLLYEDLQQYSNSDLREAFVSYNKIHKKVYISPKETEIEKRGSRGFLGKIFQRT